MQTEPQFLFFDTETTGVPAKGQYNNPAHSQTPRLVELGAVLCDSVGNELEKMSTLVKPYYGFLIPAGAALIHGITTERAEKEGMEIQFAFEEFLNLVERSNFIIAHNMVYDALVMQRVLLDLKYEGHFHMGRQLICTKELTTPVCKLPSSFGRGFKWPTLQEAHIHFFEKEFDGAHGALADVQACARIFFEGRNRKLWNF